MTSQALPFPTTADRTAARRFDAYSRAFFAADSALSHGGEKLAGPVSFDIEELDDGAFVVRVGALWLCAEEDAAPYVADPLSDYFPDAI